MMMMMRIGDWQVRLVHSMYKDVRTTFRVGDGYSKEFHVGVGVSRGSVLNPCFFIIIHMPLVTCKSALLKFFFLFLNQNICCGYSKEPSQ